MLLRMLSMQLNSYFTIIVAFVVAVCGPRAALMTGTRESSYSLDLKLDASAICNKIPGLTPKQRLICRTTPEVMVAIGEGIKIAALECRIQFKNLRWNCTSIDSNDAMVGFAQLRGTKESAFIYAISSAGVTYVITQACSLGSLPGCVCGTRKRQEQKVCEQWKWGGCGTNIQYGVKMARNFMDAREIAKNTVSLMNLHNNKVGRKSAKVNTRLDCKCHGVSGSCSIKTCWTTLLPFSNIGETLRLGYMKAKPVLPYLGSRLHTPVSLLLKRSKQPHQKPRRSHLVYLEKSPNFCNYDLKIGILGTVGRWCNKTSADTEGCDHLCCGSGYETHLITRVYQCACKFHWCCSVDCARCIEKTEQYTCN